MNIKNKNGMVLFIVLGFMLIAAVIVTTFITVCNSEMGMVRKQTDSTKAFYLAEAGIHNARTQLKLDWNNRNSISNVSLGDGNYTADIYDTDSGGTALPQDMLRIVSTGNVGTVSRKTEALLEKIGNPGNVDSAIETEGSLNVSGNAEVNGPIEEGVVLSFEYIFGLSKTEMESLVQTSYPDTYYTSTFSNDTATSITWVNAPGAESQITFNGWTGDGILIVNGDLKITGGTFNGVIWVIGALNMSGNPLINGGIFVESGVTVDTTVTGTAEINFDPVAVNEAFSLPPLTSYWREVSS